MTVAEWQHFFEETVLPLHVMDMRQVDHVGRGMAESSAAVDPEQLAVERVQGLDLSMDAGGKRREIRIGGADEDAGMIRMVAMEADEILAVMGEDGAFVCCRKAQDFVIGDGVVRLAGIE